MGLDGAEEVRPRRLPVEAPAPARGSPSRAPSFPAHLPAWGHRRRLPRAGQAESVTVPLSPGRKDAELTPGKPGRRAPHCMGRAAQPLAHALLLAKGSSASSPGWLGHKAPTAEAGCSSGLAGLSVAGRQRGYKRIKGERRDTASASLCCLPAYKKHLIERACTERGMLAGTGCSAGAGSSPRAGHHPARPQPAPQGPVGDGWQWG